MNWTQLSTSETLILIIATVLVWIFLGFLLFRKLYKKEAFIRYILFTIALFSLTLVILKPQYKIEQVNNAAILLTENNFKNIPDSIPLFALSTIKTNKKASRVNDIAELERNNPHIQNLYINGLGLEPEQLKHVKSINIQFQNKDFPEGFIHLSYTRKINKGELLQISGSYLNNSTDSVKIILELPEGLQDSITIGYGKQDFFLEGHPTVEGNFVGNIKIYHNKKNRTEPLSYSVKSKKKLRFLILQDFPSFEINYLKDWLSKQKHQIELRTHISRNKISSQQINFDKNKSSYSLLSQNNLEKTDILISDSESLKKLSASEKNELLKAIENGLGVLILPDPDWIKMTEVFGLKFNMVQGAKDHFKLTNQKYDNKDYPEKLPVAFLNNQSLVPILQSNDNETLAAFIPVKNGKIGVHLVVNTYTWLLKGENKFYNAYWTDLIQSLYSRKEEFFTTIHDSPFLWKNNFSIIELTESNNSRAIIQYHTSEKEIIQPRRDLPDLSKISFPFRPSETNWIEVNIENKVKDSLFVLNEEAWPDLKKSIWLRENLKYSGLKSIQSNSKNSFYKDVKLLWFYIPFFISICLVWWRERKVKMPEG